LLLLLVVVVVVVVIVVVVVVVAENVAVIGKPYYILLPAVSASDQGC